MPPLVSSCLWYHEEKVEVVKVYNNRQVLQQKDWMTVSASVQYLFFLEMFDVWKGMKQFIRNFYFL